MAHDSLQPADPPRPRSRLIDAARNGSADAQGALHRMCTRALAGFLRSQTGPALRRFTSVSDLGQEAFVRAFRALDALGPDASVSDFRRLLFRHARWVTVEHARKAGQYAGETAADAPIAEVWRDREDCDGEVTRGDDLKWMRDKMSSLEPIYADVLALRLDGHSTSVIAAKLELGVHAVRKRILRAAQHLRALTKTAEERDCERGR